MKNVREHQYRKSYVVECGKLTSNLVRSFNCTITLQEVYVREGFHLNDGQKLFFFSSQLENARLLPIGHRYYPDFIRWDGLLRSTVVHLLHINT